MSAKPKHTGQLTTAADYIRASHISRWGIVQTAMRQNIAEHQYRVWALVRQWGKAINLDLYQRQWAEEWALHHDLPEIRTGDAPTPHKTPEVKEYLSKLEYEICPELEYIEAQLNNDTKEFCKFCDTAEAVLFLRVNGLGQHAADVRKLLEDQMARRLKKSSIPELIQESLSTLFLDAYHGT
jgi:5'-deoxynucleotidase YfbR-like HD superfamily hydrolase